MTTNPTVLAWTDVETTGLDPHAGHLLLQVACILTDPQGEEIAEPYEAVVSYPRRPAGAKPSTVSLYVEDAHARANDFVRDMHTTTGLWDRLSGPDAKSLATIDSDLMDLVTPHAPQPRQVQMAGNSVRLDLNFTDVYLVEFAAHLHYRFIDVTGLAVTMDRFGVVNGRCPLPRTGPEHDAVADIRAAITEYRWLRDAVRELRARR